MEQIVKNRDVEKFVSETKYFLDEFDSIISHWDLSGNFFLHYLIEIHENVTQLLSRFTTLSLEGVGDRKSKPFFNLRCCDHLFECSKDLNKHYYTVHHTPGRVNDVRFCEMKAGLLKLEFYKKSLKYYLEFGTWCDHVLCLYLKKIYRKVNFTLDPFREEPVAVPAGDKK
ncbi:hypothetical protein AND_008120 [Anopheles darlingi]|uniref:Uncharacterized protein n=1 Tax=Anopheles darlingi TaxID=43151 RepID=W5J8E6_ANODA|nr:hypothetical protein AND_008120 [Anopheles darlingi]